MKCGLIEENKGEFVDNLSTDAYVWYEKNWQHDEYNHVHQRYQLTYVEEGYQYFHIEHKTYLVPQNHVIWIPSGKTHRTTSEAKTVDLMLLLFKTVYQKDFYQDVHVFSAPIVLKEMLLYASKWNKLQIENEEKTIFLNAILSSLPYFCNENESLQIPIPRDKRLTPVCHYINANYTQTIDMDYLADKAQMSVRNLQRVFKKETGITLQKYTQLIRILKSIELLNENQFTLSEIAYKIGYKSLSAFSSSYKEIMKTKPKLQK